MTVYLETVPGTFAPWAGEALNGIRYPRSISNWSAEDLAAIGLYVPKPADPVPEGKVVTGQSIQRVDGVVKWVCELEDAPVPVVTSDQVDAERDRRIAAGFIFQGKLYQSRPEDRENMAGASIAALAAMGNGALPNDFRWHGGDSDFVWIAEDNSLTPMDAQTMFALGQTAMAHKQALIFKARALKNMDPIPADYADDKWWTLVVPENE